MQKTKRNCQLEGEAWVFLGAPHSALQPEQQPAALACGARWIRGNGPSVSGSGARVGCSLCELAYASK
jgi:hypothetical protein